MRLIFVAAVKAARPVMALCVCLSASSTSPPPGALALQSQGVATPGRLSLPPEAASIRKDIEKYLQELERASRRARLEDCLPFSPAPGISMEEDATTRPLLVLATGSKSFPVAQPLRPVADALARIEAGFLFEPTGVSGRRLRFPEYGHVYVKYADLYNESWVRTAHFKMDGQPDGHDVVRSCAFGLSEVQPAPIAAVRAALDLAETALRSSLQANAHQGQAKP